MKIKIIFIEYPYEIDSLVQAGTSDEKVIFIQDPCNITRIEGERHIVNLSGDKITYEDYCAELKKIIFTTIDAAQLNKMEICDVITIEGCKEPPNFQVLNEALAHTKIRLASKCNLIIKDCSFGGSLYVNAVINFIKSVNSINNRQVSSGLDESSQQPSSGSTVFLSPEEASLLSESKNKVIFNIILDEKLGKSKLSDHDRAKLAALNNVMFISDKESPASLRRFTDDQLLSINNTDNKFSRFKAPTYFFKTTPNGYEFNQSKLQKRKLLDFFSSSAQQRSDYTCGPAALKMLAEYYASMKSQICDQPIANLETWQTLNTMNEIKLAEQVKTTEEEGSEIGDMRAGLMNLGLLVIDDQAGMRSDKHDDAALQAHKEKLWDKLKMILELGVPIIINMHDREGIGHYEVAIGIDDDQNIIFAEPGTALNAKVEFEVIPKKLFLDRWENMSEQRHGRYLIAPPNEASARQIESILSDMPHLFNGMPNNLAMQRHLMQDQDTELGEQEEGHSSPTPGSR